METNLFEFIENALGDLPETHLKIKVGDLSNQDLMLISSLAGKDCIGFIRTMDKFAVRHVFKNHSDEARERLRGQLPISIEDFLLIEIVIANYDLVLTEINKLGNIIVHYEKDFDNFRLVYVEEIRNKRREIALQTMYKQKTRKS
ncbi:MAG: hypothetical protein ACKVU0_07765 [Saprospiraceae bacterium]